MNKKQIAMIFAAAIFTCIFTISIVAATDEPKTAVNADQLSSYAENTGELGDIAKRAEKRIKEVDEDTELAKKKLESVKRERYFDDFKEERAGTLLSKEDIARLEAERAQKENAIRTRAGSEIQYVETTQATRQEVSQAVPAPRPQLSARGMVNGIVFYEDKGAALIAGEVIRENDVVMGAKIVRIAPGYVEFEKQGNQWKQQVGQFPPSAVWGEQPQQISPAQPAADINKIKTGQ